MFVVQLTRVSSLCFLRFDLPLPIFCDYIANIEMGHLAHLGSQSENRIRFTLPTGTASDMITKLSDFV